MFEKISKENMAKLVAVLLIASVAILAISIFTEDTDGRKQIIDRNGGSEEQLCAVLSQVKGAGEVEVMVEYGSDNEVKGVIVLAEGGDSPVVSSNLTNGVATLFDIPATSVIVFEKKSDVKNE